jgi:hypothetical protein
VVNQDSVARAGHQEYLDEGERAGGVALDSEVLNLISQTESPDEQGSRGIRDRPVTQDHLASIGC